MAREALRVIRGEVVVQRLMRVVARDARQARISLAPATAALQPIRLKAHVLDALQSRHRDVVPGTMTGAAKVHFRHGPQTRWVENSLAALGVLFVVHELGVFGAGTVTSFAVHSKDEAGWIEPGPRGGSGGVTPKATAQSIWRNRPAKRLLQVLRRLERVAWSQIQALQIPEETHAALEEHAVPLIHVGLALVPQAKGPAEGFGNGIGAVANAVVSGGCLFRDRKSERPGFLKDRLLLGKRGGVCSQTGGARHGRFDLRGRDLRMASRAFLGAHEIIQRRRLLRRPPSRRSQPLVGCHLRFGLLLGERIRAGRLFEEGDHYQQRHGRDTKQSREQWASLHLQVNRVLILFPHLRRNGGKTLAHRLGFQYRSEKLRLCATACQAAEALRCGHSERGTLTLL